MKFKERLQYLRLEKELSEIQLSQKVGISESAIRLYERGKLSINLDHLHILADFFDVTPGLLLGTSFPNLPPEEAIDSYRLVKELLLIRHKERQEAGDSFPAHAESISPPAEDANIPAALSDDRHWQTSLRAGVVAVYNRIISADSEANKEYIEDYWPVNNTLMQLYGHDLPNYFYFRISGHYMEPTLNDQSVVLVKRQIYVDNNDLALMYLPNNAAFVKRLNRFENKLILLSDNKSYPAQICEQDNCIILGKVLWKAK